MLRIPSTAIGELQLQSVKQHGNLARVKRVIGKPLLHRNFVTPRYAELLGTLAISMEMNVSGR